MQTRLVGKNETFVRNLLVLTVLILFVLCSAVPAQDDNSISALRQMGKAFAAIAEKASPAVVGIKAEKVITKEYTTQDWPFGDSPFDDDFFERFFGSPHRRQSSPKRKFRQMAQGSGFIISDDGYILTNNHLVGKAEKVKVQLTENRELDAKVIGSDPESDVALVKIDGNDLPYLELADSDVLEVGEWVIAIGNPFGLNHTVTAGIVSAKGRSNVGLATYEDFIQTDAAINPGNSGGPLLNLDGKVIGINTAIISRSGGNMGIGLAIPINMAHAVYEQLIEAGKVVRGYLGVTLQELTPGLAKSFGLKESTKGVILTEVWEDSAAEKAGLKHNDIVVELDGRTVEKAKELQKRVAMLKPGTKVKVVVLRDGEKKNLTVKLGERPKLEQIAGIEPEITDELGFSVQNLTDELMQRLGYKDLSGVVVTKVRRGSIAAEKGLAAGMLILEVNRKSIGNTKEFYKEIGKTADNEAVVLLVTDGRYRRFVILELPKSK